MSEHDIDVELLICLIRDKPVLWDKTYEFYRSKTSTREAWNEVYTAIRPDYNDLHLEEKHNLQTALQRKWTYLKDSWIKWKTKNQDKSKKPTDTETSDILRNILFNGDSLCSGLGEKYNISEELFHEINSATDQSQSADMNAATADNCDNNVTQASTTPEDNFTEAENRHLMFFKGILPSLENFSDNETLEFQIGVLNVIQNITTKNAVS